MICTHVRSEALGRVPSPLDSLYEEESGIETGTICSCMHAEGQTIGKNGVDINKSGQIR